jgi:hypothetical protein
MAAEYKLQAGRTSALIAELGHVFLTDQLFALEDIK